MLKRLFSIITISLILTGSFFNAYSSINHVYADDNTDAWTQVTTNEQLVEAFRYYCKSRDLTIEGSVADAVTSFTTKTFNGLCNTLGIDMTALQAQIKYQTDGNLGTRFLFNTLSIDAYNRIFAQFLQDNDLEVGDKVEDQLIHSGIYYTGYDGYTAELYMFSYYTSGNTNTDYCTNVGTYYKYSYSDLLNRISGSFQVRQSVVIDLTYNGRYTMGDVSGYLLGYSNKVNNNLTNTMYLPEQGTGGYILFRVSGDNMNVIRVGSYTRGQYQNQGVYNLYQLDRFTLNNDLQTTNIYITTNNNVINNNNYEGDTIINNNGTTGDDDDPDIPDPNPGPTPDPPTIPDSGGWQDFSLPDMPNDWLIYGMEKKFPFDIPFNILFALSLLNHEPEIPKFEGDIDLQVCTWHYDIDLTPFDDIATILRKFEVLGFIIGLAILTKNLINWG